MPENNHYARSALMLENHLTHFADGMIVEMIMTGMDRLVTTACEENVATARDLMGGHFDQIPVLDDGKIVGMIHANDLAEKPSDTDLLSVMHHLGDLALIKSTDGFHEAIRRLEGHPYLIVFDPGSGNFSGLLHFSDLNKQAVRIFCYLWLSALEMGMAEMLETLHPSLEDWLRYLDEFRQVTILGRWELEKRQNIELSPVEGVELSDLKKVFDKLPGMVERLGVSKGEYSKWINHVITLRNYIMHPVRLLVRDHAAVASLRKRVDDLRKLVTLTQTAISASVSCPTPPIEQ